MQTMHKKRAALITSGLTMLALLIVASPTLASTQSSSGKGFFKKNVGHFASFKPKIDYKKPVVPAKAGATGKISVISGSTLTVTAGDKTYTVDASAAKITKGFGRQATSSTIADLKVGDMIAVSGAVSGTNITAQTIMIFSGQRNSEKDNRMMPVKPIAAGKVTAVNGTSFTIKGNGMFSGFKKGQSVSFTVKTDSSTVFKKDGKTASLSDITAGVVVTVSGTIDAASSTISANSVNIMTTIKHQVQPKKGISSFINKFSNIFKKK
jgi:hypothetical protein